MGLFKKKPDPISERAKSLTDQIAALEVEIQRLSEAKASAPEPAEVAPSAASPFASKASPAAQPAPSPAQNPATPQPRLRSTAVPYGQAAAQAATAASAPVPAAKAPEPVFENIDHNRIQAQVEEPTTATHYNDLGVRKFDLPAVWRRLRNHFRGPATNNPKLVNYLAAGSIQGLRPLRYEKRVARNRFIFLVIILVIVLWGIISFFIRRT